MDHWGWNVGTVMVVVATISLVWQVFIVGKPREPLSPGSLLESIGWTALLWLAFLGVLPW